MAIMMPMPPRKGRPEKPYVPPSHAWRGAALGAVAAAFATLCYLASRIDSRLGGFLDLVVILLIGAVLLALAGALAAGAVALVRRAPLLWLGAAAGAAGAVAGVLLLLGATLEGLIFWLLLVVPPALLGGAVGLAFDRGLQRWTATFLCASLLVMGLDGWWLLSPGAAPAPPAAAKAETSPVALGGPSPGEPGAYEVRTLSYGSGADKHRPEYGDRATLVTGPIDASALLEGWGRLRTFYWGFGPERLPINGRVWYPAGEGPFPLVLIVHGNHAMTAPSEMGYAYLGELLASRGYIVASVDENFLNLSTSAGDLKGENDARAWLLLQHLGAWQRWNATVGTPFYRRVDMNNIALVGHSRGGEAAYLAAAMGDLPYLPDNAAVPLGFHFKIKAVAAIAPTDGQYQPAGKLPALTGVSYLTLQGSLDSDVSLFLGARQYQRTVLPPESDAFKAAVVIPGANHGQFNTVWGRRDWADLAGLLLATRPLMAGEEQRQIAKVYLSAFLDATLKGNRAYRPLFADARAGAGWLPSALVSLYADGSRQMVSDYEEDLDLLTTTAPGGSQRGENLALWREGAPDPQGENTAVYLEWKQEGGAYTLALPDNLAQAWDLGAAGRALSFALADARAPKAGLKPLDLTVELETTDGTIARLPLSHWAGIPVPAPRRMTKLGPLEAVVRGNPLPVFQTYTLPLADFTAGGRFDPARVRAVRLRFDRTAAGAVYLDDVAFVRIPR